jgi:histidine ammonia-lyase
MAAILRGPDKLGRTRQVYARVRARVPTLGCDRPMADDITAVTDRLPNGGPLDEVAREGQDDERR